MADAYGNDITLVRRPITGSIFVNLGAGTPITVANLKDGFFKPEITPGGWQNFGLIKVDGGPEWTLEADGDPIDFWQDGYSVPSGLSIAEVVFNVAEYSNLITQIQTGVAPDEDGYSVIDAGGSPFSYGLFFKEIYRGGSLRHRTGTARIAIAEDASERGNVIGHPATAKFNYNEGIGGHLEQVLFNSAPVAPVTP